MGDGLVQTNTYGVGGGLSAGGDPEFGEDVRDVGLGSAGADEQRGGDLWIGTSLDQQPKDLAFAGRQLSFVMAGVCSRACRFGGNQHSVHLCLNLLRSQAIADLPRPVVSVVADPLACRRFSMFVGHSFWQGAWTTEGHSFCCA